MIYTKGQKKGFRWNQSIKNCGIKRKKGACSQGATA
jgi:hypothetical protein